MRKRLQRLPVWIDKLWPWGPIVLLVLAVLTGLNSISKQPAKSDPDQINDVVHNFGKAVADKRGEDACALLTLAAQKQLVAEVPTVTCPVAVRSFGLGFDPIALGGATLKKINVTGTSATIARPDLVTAHDVSIGLALTFAKTGGHWQISALTRAP
jgi:hypothetical protein